ncbi:MAG: hypothetical protein AB8G22_15485 [Saprospiraceae bacterium]
MIKGILINLTLILVATISTLGISEYFLRTNNFLLNLPISHHANEPVMQEYDAVLGWRNKAGHYNYPPYSTDVMDNIQVDILENGFRSTSKKDSVRVEKAEKILFVGGSFVQGLAISDEETMAWKIQESFPAMEVINGGVPAYGTYQSLLSLEQYLVKMDSVKTVFYGLLDHHTHRNVATPFWMDLLSGMLPQNHVEIPYVSLENDQLVRHPPQAYRRISLGSTFAIVKLIERTVFNHKQNIKEKDRILMLLLEEMEQLVEANGAKLVVIGFNLEPNHLALLEQHQFTVLDCQWDLTDTSYIVKGEGHPSGKMNAEWAEEVATYLNGI